MDVNKVLGALSGNPMVGGFAGGVAGGALTNVLMGKKGRKHAKTLLKAGGIAALGGLAYKAYQQYQQNQAGAPAGVAAAGAQTRPPAASAAPVAAGWQALPAQSFEVDTSGAEGSKGLLLVRAMIAAALADGHMDAGERDRIVGKIDELGLAPDEKALVADELLKPKSIDEIASAVDDQASAIEVYAASLLAVDETRPEGREYLEALARKLSLPSLLTDALGSRIKAADAEAAALG